MHPTSTSWPEPRPIQKGTLMARNPYFNQLDTTTIIEED